MTEPKPRRTTADRAVRVISALLHGGLWAFLVFGWALLAVGAVSSYLTTTSENASTATELDGAAVIANGLAILILLAGIIVAAVTTSRLISRGLDTAFLGDQGPTELSTREDWLNAAFTLTAGSAEEPFFAALPVLLVAAVRARRTIGPWLVLVAIAGSASWRGLIHIYQGVPWALDAVFWGAVATYAYYRYRSLTGLIIGHTLYNAMNLGTSLDLPVLKWAAIITSLAAVATFFALAPTTRAHLDTNLPHHDPDPDDSDTNRARPLVPA